MLMPEYLKQVKEEDIDLESAYLRMEIAAAKKRGVVVDRLGLEMAVNMEQAKKHGDTTMHTVAVFLKATR